MTTPTIEGCGPEMKLGLVCNYHPEGKALLMRQPTYYHVAGAQQEWKGVRKRYHGWSAALHRQGLTTFGASCVYIVDLVCACVGVPPSMFVCVLCV